MAEFNKIVAVNPANAQRHCAPAPTAQQVLEVAQSAGHTGTLPAVAIREHMEVIAACGARIGKVDRVEGDSIKLTKNDSQAGGKHHFIPLSWVQSVDEQVHLNKNSEDAMRDWRTDPTDGT